MCLLRVWDRRESRKKTFPVQLRGILLSELLERGQHNDETTYGFLSFTKSHSNIFLNVTICQFSFWNHYFLLKVEQHMKRMKEIHLFLLNEIFQADLTFWFVLPSLPKSWKKPAMFCQYESFLKVLIHLQNLKNALFSSFSQITSHICWTFCLPLFHSVSSIFLFSWSGSIINNSDVLAKLLKILQAQMVQCIFINLHIKSTIYTVLMHHLLMKRVITLSGQPSTK